MIALAEVTIIKDNKDFSDVIIGLKKSPTGDFFNQDRRPVLTLTIKYFNISGRRILESLPIY